MRKYIFSMINWIYSPFNPQWLTITGLKLFPYTDILQGIWHDLWLITNILIDELCKIFVGLLNSRNICYMLCTLLESSTYSSIADQWGGSGRAILLYWQWTVRLNIANTDTQLWTPIWKSFKFQTFLIQRWFCSLFAQYLSPCCFCL